MLHTFYSRTRFLRTFLMVLLASWCAPSVAELQITSFHANGVIGWTNAPVPGICTVEFASSLDGSWTPLQNAFSTLSSGSVAIPHTGGFYRVAAIEVPATRSGFSNLVSAFGILETVAGDGFGRTDNVSFWRTESEGGPATDASLSRPHFAMADRVGKIYIADKNSHAILRVETNGTIHTHAGTHIAGFNGEGPMSATNLQLNAPNALWVRADGTVYVLDTDNGRVRRVDTNGIATTLFLAKADGTALGGGRMLWVADNESEAYFGNTDRIRRWRPGEGVKTAVNNFVELGTFHVEATGDLVVADRGSHYVYRITSGGVRTVIAGNGTTSGGADGDPAVQVGLNGPRGIWPVPTGGYLILLHDGSQLWYLDMAGMAHLLINGAGGSTHDGDGLPFYDPSEPKISEGRSVSMDSSGNILICESDYGFVRRVRFERLSP